MINNSYRKKNFKTEKKKYCEISVRHFNERAMAGEYLLTRKVTSDFAVSCLNVIVVSLN